jgi:hypothetical protein
LLLANSRTGIFSSTEIILITSLLSKSCKVMYQLLFAMLLGTPKFPNPTTF